MVSHSLRLVWSLFMAEDTRRPRLLELQYRSLATYKRYFCAVPLAIVDLDGGWELEVPVAGATLEALRFQIARINQTEVFLSPVCERIGAIISETILEVLDPDLRPPTQAQVKFALDIARELSVNLPGEALQFRSTMHDFLTRYSDLFYKKLDKKIY